MALVAVFWLVGLACLIAALAGTGVIKIGTVEIPAFSTRLARSGAVAVGVIALLLGWVVFVRQSDTGSITSPVSTKSTLQGASVTTNGTIAGTSEASESTPANDPVQVLWHGTIGLTEGSGVDIGTPSPMVEQPGYMDSSLYVYQGLIYSAINNGLSAWTGSGTPGAEDCVNLLRTHSVGTLEPKAGLQFCAHGDQYPRVAYLKVTSYDVATSTANIDVTLWDLQFS
ncbi:hypothetical protein KGQ20_07570 [Catenulispora sp. NF23]|uniref:Uncharacterized protein n=1 Tax=Catenulispora pinistramenti TaxID=2705254 RepID=A0ABS5KNN5_9ACTN|nr:hypothetical protein [Catenulispora pinistramenti]MBS2532629.1 hypothetical protein [Catenulispora pinistramenti]MBS2547614.1 hypothetical protein [Catenulispora pinistramenti]